jgi:hypothetical protein
VLGPTPTAVAATALSGGRGTRPFSPPARSDDTGTLTVHTLAHAACAPPNLHPGAAGIGRAATLALCERGWRVFAGVLTEGEAQEMRELHAGAEPLLLDVTE